MEVYQQTLRISYKKPRLHRYTHWLTVTIAHTSFPSPRPNRIASSGEQSDCWSSSGWSLYLSISFFDLVPCTCPLQGCLPTGTKHPFPRSFLCILASFGQGWSVFCSLLVVWELHQPFKSPLTTTREESPNDHCLMVTCGIDWPETPIQPFTIIDGFRASERVKSICFVSVANNGWFDQLEKNQIGGGCLDGSVS